MQFFCLCADAVSVRYYSLYKWMNNRYRCCVSMSSCNSMRTVWPWGCWEWTGSLPEVQLCCDPQGLASCRKVTCEGCRALHDDKHDAYEIRWWQITSERGDNDAVLSEGLDRTVCATPNWSLQTQFCSQSVRWYCKIKSIQELIWHLLTSALSHNFTFSGLNVLWIQISVSC